MFVCVHIEIHELRVNEIHKSLMKFMPSAFTQINVWRNVVELIVAQQGYYY